MGPVSKTCRVVQTLFAIGYAGRLLLEFVPAYECAAGQYSPGYRPTGLYSSAHLLTELPAQGGTELFAVLVFFYLAAVFFIYRALKRPSRAVFISGAVLVFIWSGIFFSGPCRLLPIPGVLRFVAAALTLPSCFVRPPNRRSLNAAPRSSLLH